MRIELELPYPPSVNRYYGHGQRRSWITRDGQAYRDEVNRIVRVAHADTDPKYPITDCDVVVSIAVLAKDRRKRDLDNLLKCLCDSLEGLVYEDDAQICALQIHREMEGETPAIDPAGLGRISVVIVDRKTFLKAPSGRQNAAQR